MRAEFTRGSVTLYRWAIEPRFYGHLGARGEHRLFASIKAFLNVHGFDLIKKRAAKDGHLLDDVQPYLRSRSPKSSAPHVYIISRFFAIEGANEPWNRDGCVALALHLDVWKTGQDTEAMIKGLCERFDCMTWID